ncbi:uncharacterized protein SPPG_01802 [Spizellomyces punctatus DAOM BR117]|uniref:SWIRM domain-containing protein n=1 Tax=Spizellomyces punctatus (strain DAOM BR117) TaxID=645134 RepID=A0A0L0HPJ4_SPIPD|nr:uncharacterized protein SPPG_01802 [Spizellomyces punctatus DAOM BR117]KND02719.1 hypothetical protein SPPG_01802 [Spizellomyces punctatus DAOM BR117]|eukprot:XP_016610758.1 hypothetical protein SPPG_01802 [Spizellomyces punctatus DAOM BR117]
MSAVSSELMDHSALTPSDECSKTLGTPTPSFPSPPVSEVHTSSPSTTITTSQCSCAASHKTVVNSPASHNCRKIPVPHRSLPSSLTSDQKRELGIIKLDVYTAYRLEPAQLLFDREARRKALWAWKRKRVAYGDSEDETFGRKVGRPRRRGRGGRKPMTNRFAEGFSPDDMALMPKTTGTTQGAPVITWTKGEPLLITPATPYYSHLTPEELHTCSTLRLLPETYLKIKETLLTAKAERGPFKKRDAQKWCRVDVNKTGKLYDWFVALGWLEAYDAPPSTGV